MHSVVETIENGYPTAVAVQSLWLNNNKLCWPPGKNIDRQSASAPQSNWLQFDCKLLKSGIGNTFHRKDLFRSAKLSFVMPQMQFLWGYAHIIIDLKTELNSQYI